MRDEAEAARALSLYGDTVRRICFNHLRATGDVEDVFQDVFLRYLLHTGEFESDDHERSWLIRVAVNACKDVLKSARYKRVRSLEESDLSGLSAPQEDRELLDAVLRLSPKYRDVIYLHYYEGYSARDIASILGKKENTIYTWMDRARKQLRDRLGEGEAS